MTKEEIIDRYEFDEVVSGHMIMSEPDLHNIMDLFVLEETEQLQSVITTQADRINELVKEVNKWKKDHKDSLDIHLNN